MIGQGHESLAKRMEVLSKPIPFILDINPDGWIHAQRLVLSNTNSREALTEPIIIKVNKDDIVGEGGMRTTYSAQVKSTQDGVDIITDYVAKVIKNLQFQDLKLHATDARMYEACSVQLHEFKSVINACRRVPSAIKSKARDLEVCVFNLL